MTEIIDKNIIRQMTWEISNTDIENSKDSKKSKLFVAYTGDWCSPCKKIKPYVLSKMENYKLLNETYIDKEKFKENINNYVPFFMIFENDKKIDSLQSSNEEIFHSFLIKNGILKELKAEHLELTLDF
jgi:thiol-disulfide isomerase/thioredoxin